MIEILDLQGKNLTDIAETLGQNNQCSFRGVICEVYVDQDDPIRTFIRLPDGSTKDLMEILNLGAHET